MLFCFLFATSFCVCEKWTCFDVSLQLLFRSLCTQSKSITSRNPATWEDVIPPLALYLDTHTCTLCVVAGVSIASCATYQNHFIIAFLYDVTWNMPAVFEFCAGVGFYCLHYAEILQSLIECGGLSYLMLGPPVSTCMLFTGYTSPYRALLYSQRMPDWSKKSIRRIPSIVPAACFQCSQLSIETKIKDSFDVTWLRVFSSSVWHML